jgi:hypothetical protein
VPFTSSSTARNMNRSSQAPAIDHDWRPKHGEPWPRRTTSSSPVAGPRGRARHLFWCVGRATVAVPRSVWSTAGAPCRAKHWICVTATPSTGSNSPRACERCADTLCATRRPSDPGFDQSLEGASVGRSLSGRRWRWRAGASGVADGQEMRPRAGLAPWTHQMTRPNSFVFAPLSISIGTRPGNPWQEL